MDVAAAGLYWRPGGGVCAQLFVRLDGIERPSVTEMLGRISELIGVICCQEGSLPAGVGVRQREMAL